MKEDQEILKQQLVQRIGNKSKISNSTQLTIYFQYDFEPLNPDGVKLGKPANHADQQRPSVRNPRCEKTI